MREIPIIFTGPSISAILEGRKIQTARPIIPRGKNLCHEVINSKWNAVLPHPGGGWMATDGDQNCLPVSGKGFKCRYGEPGDRLRVKEGARYEKYGDLWLDVYESAEAKVEYDARSSVSDYHHVLFFTLNGLDKKRFKEGRKSAIFMPRWASRIILENLNIEARRIKTFGEDDAAREGYKSLSEFFKRWEEMWKSRGFGVDMNPWVWVVLFRLASVIGGQTPYCPKCGEELFSQVKGFKCLKCNIAVDTEAADWR